MGPIPAPVAIRRRDLNKGAKDRKFAAGGLRIQIFLGGLAMMFFVQSPAAEMMISAVCMSGEGMVAKACHSKMGMRLELKCAVDVYGIEA
jgi:hypothetical protein